jgi:hypothetical protein
MINRLSSARRSAQDESVFLVRMTAEVNDVGLVQQQ